LPRSKVLERFISSEVSEVCAREAGCGLAGCGDTTGQGMTSATPSADGVTTGGSADVLGDNALESAGKISCSSPVTASCRKASSAWLSLFGPGRAIATSSGSFKKIFQGPLLATASRLRLGRSMIVI